MTRIRLPTIPSLGAWAESENGLVSWLPAIEGAVADHQRDVARTPWQRQRCVERVVADPHPGETAPDVARGPVEAVVVVPVHRRALRPGRPRRSRRCRCAARRARSAGRCRTPPASDGWRCRSTSTFEGCWSRPPGCPSSADVLWAPCRCTVSSPAFAGSLFRKVARVRSRPAGGSSGPGSRRRRSTSASSRPAARRSLSRRRRGRTLRRRSRAGSAGTRRSASPSLPPPSNSSRRRAAGRGARARPRRRRRPQAAAGASGASSRLRAAGRSYLTTLIFPCMKGWTRQK